jgi:hypothetical protein
MVGGGSIYAAPVYKKNIWVDTGTGNLQNNAPGPSLFYKEMPLFPGTFPAAEAPLFGAAAFIVTAKNYDHRMISRQYFSGNRVEESYDTKSSGRSTSPDIPVQETVTSIPAQSSLTRHRQYHYKERTQAPCHRPCSLKRKATNC